MTKSEHANRSRKAIAIADRLQAVDCDADTAARLTDAVWAQAARAAAICYAEQHQVPAPQWTDASEQTRVMVIALLIDRDRGRFERADSLHPTSVTAANAHDTMADVIAAYLAASAVDATCTGTTYPVNPDCPTEGTDIYHAGPCPSHPDAEYLDAPTCDHPQVAYCDECDPDPTTRQHEEVTGIR